jgi:hypothetical protein
MRSSNAPRKSSQRKNSAEIFLLPRAMRNTAANSSTIFCAPLGVADRQRLHEPRSPRAVHRNTITVVAIRGRNEKFPTCARKNSLTVLRIFITQLANAKRDDIHHTLSEIFCDPLLRIERGDYRWRLKKHLQKPPRKKHRLRKHQPRNWQPRSLRRRKLRPRLRKLLQQRKLQRRRSKQTPAT